MSASVADNPLMTWDRPRDVARRLDYTTPHIYKLIHTGQLRAIHTRLGYLVDPMSVARYEASGVKGKRRVVAA